jgi:hypothetical protein
MFKDMDTINVDSTTRESIFIIKVASSIHAPIWVFWIRHYVNLPEHMS